MAAAIKVRADVSIADLVKGMESEFGTRYKFRNPEVFHWSFRALGVPHAVMQGNPIFVIGLTLNTSAKPPTIEIASALSQPVLPRLSSIFRMLGLLAMVATRSTRDRMEREVTAACERRFGVNTRASW